MIDPSIAEAHLHRFSSDGNDCMLVVTSFSFSVARHHFGSDLGDRQGAPGRDVDIQIAFSL